MCILWFYWLIVLYIFTPLPWNLSFLIVKYSCIRGKSVMSKNHCERTSCWWVCACATHLWFVHLPKWHFPLHLPPLQRPGMCAVDNFQPLRFVNSQSPDKFTGKPKIFSLPTSSQESVKKNQGLRLYLHCAPSMRSMAHPNISKCVDLLPITMQYSPHWCRKRRINFRNWRSKIGQK